MTLLPSLHRSHHPAACLTRVCPLQLAYSEFLPASPLPYRDRSAA